MPENPRRKTSAAIAYTGSMLIAETSFAEAVAAFKSFLAENGVDKPLLWPFEEDVFERNSDRYEAEFWIKLPLPRENEQLASQLYEIGRNKGLGICLSAYAKCDAGLCCGVLIPADEEDGEYLLLSQEHLKFSFNKDPMPVAIPVISRLKWALFGFLPFLCRPGNFFAYLRSKRELRNGTL